MRIFILCLLLALIGAGVMARRPRAVVQPRSEAPLGRIDTLGYGPAKASFCGMKPMGLAELATTSRGLAVVEVLENRCVWDEGKRLIWTETRLRIERSLFGELKGEVTIREPGGEIPPVGVLVSTAVRYRPGERCLVFVARDALDQLRTAGVHQGKMPLVRGPDGIDRLDTERCLPHVLRSHFAPRAPITVEGLAARVSELRRGGKEGR